MSRTQGSGTERRLFLEPTPHKLIYNPSPWLKNKLGRAAPGACPGAGAQKAGSCARLRRQSMLELSGPV